MEKLHKEHPFVKQYKLDDYEIETSNSIDDYLESQPPSFFSEEERQKRVDDFYKSLGVEREEVKKVSCRIRQTDFLKLQEQSKKKGMKEDELIEKVIHDYLLEVA